MSLSLASPAVAAPLRADAVVAFTVLAEVVTPAVDEVTTRTRGVDEVTTFRTEDAAEGEEDAAFLSENLEYSVACRADLATQPTARTVAPALVDAALLTRLRKPPLW